MPREPLLEALVSIRAHIPEDAMSAGLLGTERAGHGIRVRDDGLILTIGYVINEAEEIWIGSHDGRAVPGFVVGNDFRTGLALIRPMMPLPGRSVPIGSSESLRVGEPVWIAGSGRADPQVVDAEIIAKQEFAGRWEYVLDEAIFTTPPHESWSGAALMDMAGRLCGVGSLVIQGFEADESVHTVNMFVPIDILTPVMDEISIRGRRSAPPRPWLGMLVHDDHDTLVVVGIYRDCPADRAGLRPGDVVLRVDGKPVHNLAHMFRTVWSLGDAGVDVPLLVLRDAQLQETTVKSAPRGDFLRKGTVQ
ncbi:MAG: S1C family serine protease [Rhodospirillaceae bacterium]|nr:S1C family serine protease [Rhodospirillaceae bacterium]